jgi:hypothetical protein
MLASLIVILAAFVGSPAGGQIVAPVPKEKPVLSIEGKYTLLSVSYPVNGLAPGLGGGGLGGGGGGFAVGPRGLAPAYLVGPAFITKNEITLEGNNRVSPLAGLTGPTTMEYTVDLTKTPMTIDVDTISLRGKKSKSLGLVEMNGNRLIIAIAKEGDERPKTTDEADGVTVYYFQKAPPPPRTEYRIVTLTIGKEEAVEKELNKLAEDGFELVSTTQPTAADPKSSVTTVHLVLKRTVK